MVIIRVVRICEIGRRCTTEQCVSLTNLFKATVMWKESCLF